MIGKLEEVVLLASIRAGSEALASAIYEVVHSASQKHSFASIYTTLGRLQKKGMLRETEVADAQGRPRRAFSITGEGTEALSEALSITKALQGPVAGGLHV